MAKRGDTAREAVKNKIIEAFGDSYVGTIDKKIYVEAQDGPGGETLQFAITMTMPKNTVARSDAQQTSVPASPTDWTGPSVTAEAPPFEISEDDKAKVNELMARLGLN